SQPCLTGVRPNLVPRQTSQAVDRHCDPRPRDQPAPTPSGSSRPRRASPAGDEAAAVPAQHPHDGPYPGGEGLLLRLEARQAGANRRGVRRPRLAALQVPEPGRLRVLVLSPPCNKLLLLCRGWQEWKGNDPFFLSARAAGRSMSDALRVLR